MARTKNATGGSRRRPRDEGAEEDRLALGHSSTRRRMVEERAAAREGVEASGGGGDSLSGSNESYSDEEAGCSCRGGPGSGSGRVASCRGGPGSGSGRGASTRAVPTSDAPTFCWGPEELTLLHGYSDHVAAWTWHSLLQTREEYVERGNLKCATVGKKLEKLRCEDDDEGFEGHAEVRALVQASGLYRSCRRAIP